MHFWVALDTFGNFGQSWADFGCYEGVYGRVLARPMLHSFLVDLASLCLPRTIHHNSKASTNLNAISNVTPNG